MGKRSNNDTRHNYHRKISRGSYSSGSSGRGRNNYYSRRGYSWNNDKYIHKKWWERIPARQSSRSVSPVEGSQEFMDRKIQQTSAIIMRQLLSPNEPIIAPTKVASQDTENNIREPLNEILKPKENKEKQTEKVSNKIRKTSTGEINVKEIHERIMNRISNLNDGRKKNFINAHDNTRLDTAIQHIHKQKRLELSRVLRDMCSSSYNPQQSGELINSIIPDIGIKLEELPIDVIQELRQTLNLDLDEDLLDSVSTTNDSHISISSVESNDAIDSTSVNNPTCDNPIPVSCDELNAAIDSIQVKTEETDAGSIEITLEDIADCDGLSDNIQYNSEEIEPIRAEELVIQDTLEGQKAPEDPVDWILDPANCGDIKQETEEAEIGCRSVASTFSQSTVLASNINDKCKDTELVDRSDLINQNIDNRANVDHCTNQNPHNRTSIDDHVDYNTDYRISKTGCVNQNIDNRTDTENRTDLNNFNEIDEHNEEGAKTDHSHGSLEDCVRQFVEGGNVINMCDPTKVCERLGVVDKCINYLSEHKASLINSLVRHCLNKNREGIGIAQNSTVSSSVNRGWSSINMSAVTSKDEDKRVPKKRKVENSSEQSEVSETQIKIENTENEDLKELDILIFPKSKDKVLVIERLNNQLVLATESGKIIYASLQNGSFLHILDVANSPITSLVFLKGMNEFVYMYVGSLDPALRIYDYNNRKIIKASALDDRIRCMDAMWDYVFMGCSGGTLIRYSTKKAKIEYEERNPGVDILVIKAGQEGPRKVLLVGHKQAPIYVRDAMSGLYLRNFSNEAITPTVYALIVNNNFLYCGTAHSNILVFSFHEGNLLHRLFAEDCKGVSCIKIYKDLLFAGSYNGSVYVYHLKVKKFLGILKGPGGSISCMEVLSNQVIVGTLTGQFGSVAIPAELRNS